VAKATARQVDVLLEVAVVVAALTGLASWTVGTAWGRGLTIVHGIAGLSLVVLAPAKVRGSVRTGLARGRPTRWLSLALAALVVVTVVLGVLHSTGLWFGVGYWSALWTHFLAAFTLLVVFLWHVVSRPSRPRLTELDRRAALHGGLAVAVSAGAYGGQHLAAAAFGLAGDRRRFTGSHEVASFAPQHMPTVSWIDDKAPESTDPVTWTLHVAGERVSVDALAARARPLRATLDCTGGWWSEQTWDAVALDELFPAGASARSINVTSSTGYSRLLPFSDRHRLHLAVGYAGEPLRRGHGAPVRLVAPGRRGPWWVKWVTSVELDDRPWWLQLPLPLE
jgi:hypothetical protein